MEKKVLLNDLIGRGTHIRTEVTPKVVIADGSYPKGEMWDANKMKSSYYTKAEVEALIAAAIASLTPSEQEPSEPSEPNEPAEQSGE